MRNFLLEDGPSLFCLPAYLPYFILVGFWVDLDFHTFQNWEFRSASIQMEINWKCLVHDWNWWYSDVLVNDWHIHIKKVTTQHSHGIKSMRYLFSISYIFYFIGWWFHHGNSTQIILLPTIAGYFVLTIVHCSGIYCLLLTDSLTLISPKIACIFNLLL